MSMEFLRDLGIYLLTAMSVSLVIAIILFFLVVRRLRGMNIPSDASFSETLLYAPFLLVVFIDLLDFALDILAAPFTWVILDRLGLKALRNVSALEALLPFTQVIPTLTLAWIGVRIFGLRLDLPENGEKYRP